MQRGVPAFSKPPSTGFRFSNTSPIIPVNNTNYSNNKQKQQQRVRIDVSRLQQQQQSSSSDDEEDQTTKPLPSSPPPPPLLDTLPAIQHQQQRPEATTLATAVVSSPLVVPHNVLRIAAGILMIWALGITLVVIIHMRANSSSTTITTTTIAPTNTFSASFVVEQNGQTYSFAVDLVDRAAYYHMCCTDTEGAMRCGIDVRHIGVHIVDKKATINVHFPPRVYLSKCTLFCTRAR
jgi:hypothetical protein